ncbi:hypothetical protein [Amycolatopsis sp. NPDC004079]|uniref:hypothetical protein n=1 Tax=Amycolatopsis sp. NPDC004079 TaxID=3154549 RepID=UPI0033A4A524
MSHPIPDIRDPHEVVLEFLDGGPDDFGRRRFFAFWLDDNVGPSCDQVGVRGQIFFTDPDRFADDRRRSGWIVRCLDA